MDGGVLLHTLPNCFVHRAQNHPFRLQLIQYVKRQPQDPNQSSSRFTIDMAPSRAIDRDPDASNTDGQGPVIKLDGKLYCALSADCISLSAKRNLQDGEPR